LSAVAEVEKKVPRAMAMVVLAVELIRETRMWF
jgi:hypothetical protein